MLTDRVASLLCDVLTLELLRIRGNSATCTSQVIFEIADHLHTIPEIISSRNPELLQHYLDAFVPTYKSSGMSCAALEAIWDELGNAVIGAVRTKLV